MKKTTVGIEKTTIVTKMATTLAGTPAKAETPTEVEAPATAETLATAKLTTSNTTGPLVMPREHSDVQAILLNVVPLRMIIIQNSISV